MVARGTRTARSSQSHGLHQLGPHARDQARAERVYVGGTYPAGAVRFWRYQVHFFGGFRHRSKRTFCRSRRDLAIRVVGTPAFQGLCCWQLRGRGGCQEIKKLILNSIRTHFGNSQKTYKKLQNMIDTNPIRRYPGTAAYSHELILCVRSQRSQGV